MYFSVKMPVKIAKKTYVPCVCYEVTKEIESAVVKLAVNGTARLYDHEVFFVNGKVAEKKVETKTSKTSSKKVKVETEKEAVEVTVDVETEKEETEDSTESF